MAPQIVYNGNRHNRQVQTATTHTSQQPRYFHNSKFVYIEKHLKKQVGQLTRISSEVGYRKSSSQECTVINSLRTRRCRNDHPRAWLSRHRIRSSSYKHNKPIGTKEHLADHILSDQFKSTFSLTSGSPEKK
ncbi:hypothetical protein K0M31_001261 [Melipona bicolor]|uniref:Uncharacterized protein n=1 Tax=Melipona bicolor TaxID=60889 RepID=A0AA40GF86_9HYME|nr:hypothetical protein K0M31_001261 [Melipona bicolor]